jgi:hypothetical protein
MAEGGKSFAAGAVASEGGQEVLKAQILNVRVYRIGQRGQESDLPLPSPPPEGAEWIAAYRLWARHGGWPDEGETA